MSQCRRCIYQVPGKSGQNCSWVWRGAQMEKLLLLLWKGYSPEPKPGAASVDLQLWSKGSISSAPSTVVESSLLSASCPSLGFQSLFGDFSLQWWAPKHSRTLWVQETLLQSPSCQLVTGSTGLRLGWEWYAEGWGEGNTWRMQITWVAMVIFPLLVAAALAPADPPISRLGKQHQEVLICSRCRQMKDILSLEKRAHVGHLVKKLIWEE